MTHISHVDNPPMMNVIFSIFFLYRFTWSARHLLLFLPFLLGDVGNVNCRMLDQDGFLSAAVHDVKFLETFPDRSNKSNLIPIMRKNNGEGNVHFLLVIRTWIVFVIRFS